MNKRIIYLFFVIILSISCSSKKHLIFNNVPIDGALNKFAMELTKSGFILADTAKKNEILLKGVFLNKDCKIYVLGTNGNNLVYKVIAELPVEGHDSLQSHFEKLQKLFSIKYGIGYSKYQQYKKRERLLYKVPAREVMQGDITKYITDSGEITLEVQEGFISITYLDQLNSEIWKREMGEVNKKELNEER